MDRWDDETETTTDTECLICGGALMFLGKLGNTEHYRCRACGYDQSHETECEQCEGPATPAGRGMIDGGLCEAHCHHEPT